MRLGKIWIFPIKSLDGRLIKQTRITSGGILENDRIYAIFDTDGKVVNGKRTARVHELRCEFDPQIREVRFWQKNESATLFQLDNPAPLEKWLGEFFGFAVVLRHEPQNGFPDDPRPLVRPLSAKQVCARSKSGFPN